MRGLAIHDVHGIPGLFQNGCEVTDAQWQKNRLRRFNWVWWIYKSNMSFH
jgi:hypothetical protein